MVRPCGARGFVDPGVAWKHWRNPRVIATASLDGPCARRACASRRLGRRNGRQARTKEQIDDIVKSRFTRRGLREDETTMEDLSSQHVRTLVTLTARSRPIR